MMQRETVAFKNIIITNGVTNVAPSSEAEFGLIIIIMFISYIAQSSMRERYDRMRITTVKS